MAATPSILSLCLFAAIQEIPTSNASNTNKITVICFKTSTSILFINFYIKGYIYLTNSTPPVPQYKQCNKLVLPFILNHKLL